MYGIRREAWKTSCIFQWGGSQSLYATFDIWAATLKGPYRLGDSFRVMLAGSLRLVPSNQTLDPLANGICQGRSLIQDSCTLHCASWVAFLASSMVVSCSFIEGISVVLVGWWICGMYPIRRSKGVLFVVADGQEFFVYCASGSQVCQLFCWVLQKTCRYCSRVWLVLSLAPSV